MCERPSHVGVVQGSLKCLRWEGCGCKQLRAGQAARRGCAGRCRGPSWVLERPCPWWPKSLNLTGGARRPRDSVLRHCPLSGLLLKPGIGGIIGNWSSLQPRCNSWFPCPCWGGGRRSDLHLPRGLSSSTLQRLARLFSVRDRDKGFSWDRGK